MTITANSLFIKNFLCDCEELLHLLSVISCILNDGMHLWICSFKKYAEKLLILNIILGSEDWKKKRSVGFVFFFSAIYLYLFIYIYFLLCMFMLYIVYGSRSRTYKILESLNLKTHLILYPLNYEFHFYESFLRKQIFMTPIKKREINVFEMERI